MATPKTARNRVKFQREALGISQAQLAKRVGVSRTGLGAIESQQLTPAVSTAIALARELGMTVERLFGESPESAEGVWAAAPPRFPARYWCAEVQGRVLRFPVEGSSRHFQRQDGLAKRSQDRDGASDLARRTLVVASCDPAIGVLAQLYERSSPFRLLALERSSREAMVMLREGLVHVAGIHFAPASGSGGNAAFLKDFQFASEMTLLSLFNWEAGIAHSRQLRLRSSRQAANADVRWIGRAMGAGSRRMQDEVLQRRTEPLQIARGHADVVSSIRTGFADAGICVRLSAEEAGVGFYSLGEDQYDFCFARADADDARLRALVEVVRSAEYKRMIAELPGYRPKRIGEQRVIGLRP